MGVYSQMHIFILVMRDAYFANKKYLYMSLNIEETTFPKVWIVSQSQMSMYIYGGELTCNICFILLMNIYIMFDPLKHHFFLKSCNNFS